MAASKDLDATYLGYALLTSKLSRATRKKVGAVLVTQTGVCIPGFNGTPTGYSNDCERRLWQPNGDDWTHGGEYVLETKPEVIHAELNCILKAAKEGVSCLNATMYSTLSPCVPCSAMLVNAGIRRFVFSEKYRNDAGIKILEDSGIIVDFMEVVL